MTMSDNVVGDFELQTDATHIYNGRGRPTTRQLTVASSSELSGIVMKGWTRLGQNRFEMRRE